MKSFVHVAVIDDEVAMELLFQGFLEEKISKHDLKLTYFDNATECLNYLDKVMHNNNEKVDIIFCDVNMPVVSGFEFLEETKKKFPSLDIYMMSGAESEEYKQKALSMDAKGFYTKPFNFDEIISIVDNFVF